MGLRPTQGVEKRLGPATALYGTVALSFVIPTRISCHATLDKSAYAPFRTEGRMKFANATKFNRKSGGAKPRDLQFREPLVEMFYDRASSLRSAWRR